MPVEAAIKRSGQNALRSALSTATSSIHQMGGANARPNPAADENESIRAGIEASGVKMGARGGTLSEADRTKTARILRNPDEVALQYLSTWEELRNLGIDPEVRSDGGKYNVAFTEFMKNLEAAGIPMRDEGGVKVPADGNVFKRVRQLMQDPKRYIDRLREAVP
jgi:hypothetical protein